MRHPSALRVALATLALLCPSAPASAQIYETFGTRAQGMGGAFVSVVDDATATWWNPAGLGSGVLFSGILQRGRWTEPADVPAAGPASRDATTAFAVLYPALALSYYRLRISEIAPTTSTADGTQDRQDQGPTGVAQRALALSQYGVTFGQSLGSNVVLASTFRLVRAGVVAGPASGTGTDALDAAAEADVPVDTKGDLDIGALITMGRARVGFNVKHMNEPEFGEDASPFVLKRQARVGFSLTTGSAGKLDAVIAAIDLDLTRTPTVFGDARHLAGGAEAWFFGRRVGVRGGASRNTVEEGRTSTSVGGSIALRRGVYLDGAISTGADDGRDGWSAGARVAF